MVERWAAILAALAAAYPEPRCGLEFQDPYQLLVAAVLSAQTTDRAVNRLTPALFARFPTARDLARAAPEEIEPFIRSLGLYRNKARNLAALARALVAEHGGAVPARREALERLPGVGVKTAGVVLANAFGVPALPVDTHVFRVAHRLGLARSRDAAGTERELEAMIPRERWIDTHHRLIQLGRQVCIARRPRCEACPLRALCPWPGPGATG